MDQTEVKKTCHSCGADVTHAARHKNAFGEYVCPTCFKDRKQSSDEWSRERRQQRTRRIFLYVLLAAAASWAFLKFLDIMNRPSDSDN